jgi:hypothetical protein
MHGEQRHLAQLCTVEMESDGWCMHGGSTLVAEGNLRKSEAALLKSSADQAPSNPVWNATIFDQGGPGAELDSNLALWLPPVPVQKPKPSAIATPPDPTAATKHGALTGEQFDAHAHHVLRCVCPPRWWRCGGVGQWLPLQHTEWVQSTAGRVNNAHAGWHPRLWRDVLHISLMHTGCVDCCEVLQQIHRLCSRQADASPSHRFPPPPLSSREGGGGF